MTKKLTIAAIDDEFGASTTYWLSQMDVYKKAGKPLNDVLSRMFEWGERRGNKS